MKSFEIPVGLLARCAGQAAVCRRVVHKYVEQMIDDVESLTRYVNTDCDAKSAARLAHRMKGASLNVEAFELKEEAAAIEKLATDNQLQEAQRHVERLQVLWADYRELTEEYLSETQCAS